MFAHWSVRQTSTTYHGTRQNIYRHKKYRNNSAGNDLIAIIMLVNSNKERDDPLCEMLREFLLMLMTHLQLLLLLLLLEV